MRNTNHNDSGACSPPEVNFRLMIPESWVESAVEQAAPECKRERLAALDAQIDLQEREEPPSLAAALCLSYYPNGGNLEAVAQESGMTVAGLLEQVADDLRNGLCALETSFRTKEGEPKIRVTGTYWSAVLRPQAAKNSRRTLAVVENVARQNIPTRQPVFRPSNVALCPVWDERPCDPQEILDSYRSVLNELRQHQDSIRQLRGSLNALRERRGDVWAESIVALRRGQADQTVRGRADLHAQVRRQYSALRVMMDLLYRRSQNERVSVTGTITAHSSGVDADATVVISVEAASYSPLLSEDALVEIRSASGPMVRARIQEVRPVTQQAVLLVTDVEWHDGEWPHGTTVAVTYIPRFGMWAHQKAVDALLQEVVHGAWPDLARLLCCPDKLAPFGVSRPSQFFCDLDPGRPALNERQREAVAGAVSTPHAFCIQGPPGTGKTTVICEIVEQLIARGERILLVAPTHVAVDEVLRRIGSRPGVRPLRLSWDSTRVAEDVQKYTPARIIEPFLAHLREPRGSRTGQWKVQYDDLANALLRMNRLRETGLALSDNADAAVVAAQRLKVAVTERDRHQPDLKAALERLAELRPQAESLVASQDMGLREAEAQEVRTRQSSAWYEKAGALIGLGTLAAHGRQVRTRREQLQEAQRLLANVQEQYRSSTDRLDALNNAVSEARSGNDTAVASLSNARIARDRALAACGESSVLREQYAGTTDLTKDMDRILNELRSGMERLGKYQHLEQRFFELVAEVDSQDEDHDRLRKDLLAVTNLFCCTTTGVAGSPELQDLAFDTLILDEASRVTDSEFLIAATRARRWLLVGDEHQLPPYVEQGDEHFLHALSALYASGRNGTPLETSVDALAHLWEEDEELHQFRRDGVTQVAHSIQASQWNLVYADPYSEGIALLRKDTDDPTKEMLRSMREHLVHSLFERIASTCRPEMRVQLVEQRRMIEPIAEIVREPVYEGHYQSPSEADLAKCGVTPLVTPTFPMPVTFLDTSLLGVKARDKLLRNSFINETEARWIAEACETMDRELAEAGEGPVTVSILSFYKAQARLVRDRLGLNRPGGRARYRRLHFAVIDAIDRIQGQESDVVFLSFCRTGGREVGPRFGQWLQDIRRLNVACTRAHRAIIFVGQRDLLGRLCHNEPAMAFYRHLNNLFDTRKDVMQVVSQFGGRSRQ